MPPVQELSWLATSKDARSRCEEAGICVIRAPADLLAVTVHAYMDEREVKPVADAQSNTSAVLRVSTRSSSRKGRAKQRERWVYADAVPEIGDTMVRMGSRVCFLRRESGQRSRVVSSGTKMSPRKGAENETRSSSLFLPHPCHWKRRQLPDAAFVLHSSGKEEADALASRSSAARGRILIRCKTAAMIVLLLESGRFDLPDEVSWCAADVAKGDWWVDATATPKDQMLWVLEKSRCQRVTSNLRKTPSREVSGH